MKIRPIIIVLLLTALTGWTNAEADTDATNDAQALIQLLDRFLAGASVDDAAVHDRFWAEELVYTSSNGTRFGKREILDGLRAEQPGPNEPAVVYSAEEVRVQLYGDTAVVTNPAFQIHTYAVVLAGGNVIHVPLGNDDAFLERIENVDPPEPGRQERQGQEAERAVDGEVRDPGRLVERVGHHHIARQHELDAARRGPIHHGSRGGQHLVLDQRSSDLEAPGLEKGVGHAAADQDVVDPFQQVGDDVDLA